MDLSCNPQRAIDEALESVVGNSSRRIAILMPSTHATLSRSSQLTKPSLAVGTANGMVGMSFALRAAASTCPPPLMLIFTDQFSSPADANVLAILPDTRVFLSPLEYILNDKYGYTLCVWTSSGLVWLAPGNAIKDVFGLVARHLQDCVTLEEEWIERNGQSFRFPGHRASVGRRQLRFLRSSAANAYRNDPENREARRLLSRIASLSIALEQGTTD